MIERFINSDASVIRIHLNCPDCGREIISGVDVPDLEYIYSDKTFAIMPSYSWGSAVCQCGRCFNISVQRKANDNGESVSLSIEDLPCDHPVLLEETDELEQSILHNKNCFETFVDSMNEVKELFDEDHITHHQVLLKMLYVQIVTCLETYLSDTLITNVDEDSSKLAAFVSEYKEYEKTSVPLNRIIDEYYGLRTIVLETLKNLTFHNIPKIRAIYESVFEIEFPSISEICRIVNIRHDLIHRNGKGKDDSLIVITKEALKAAYNTVYEFVKMIEEELGSKSVA